MPEFRESSAALITNKVSGTMMTMLLIALALRLSERAVAGGAGNRETSDGLLSALFRVRCDGPLAELMTTKETAAIVWPLHVNKGTNNP